MPDPSKPVTAEQLRAEIDQGRTSGKVPASDPAAASLGTDEEAAGTPLSPEVLHTALRQEGGFAGAHSALRGEDFRTRDLFSPRNVFIAVVVVALVVGVGLWLSRMVH